jgi:hypothetical protein
VKVCRGDVKTKEMGRGRSMEKIDIVWWIIFFVAVFVLPYFPTVLGVSLGKSVNPTFISGFITASGVFLGLLTATFINKSETLGYNLKACRFQKEIALFRVQCTKFYIWS